MELKYRPEIDGLRTVAIIAIIIYHAEIFFGKNHFLKGGFFGVDIFFVISGFLITSIIVIEYHRTGKFSISNFYERRARRLLPALFIVILASLPFAWNLLTPTRLVDFSKSVLSSLAFGSNFYWYTSLQEYGTESSLLKPFLHTWALAVEGQYYIIFPLMMLAIYRWFKISATAVFTAGLLLSLIFAELMSVRHASFSFYMFPSRFWEFLAGGLLAQILYLQPQKIKDNALLNRTMPLLGLFFIVYSIVFIDLKSHHPGLITFIPVIGTIFIILFANDKNIVTRMLSSKVFAGTGLITYSLYLWHYPIFSFGRILETSPAWYDKTNWILLTFVLSIITYITIEKPFRSKSKVSQAKLLSILSFASILIVFVMVFWIESDVSYSRLGYLSSIVKTSEPIWTKQDGIKCHSGGGGRRPAFELEKSCVFLYDPDNKFIILIGDSHAGVLSENLRILAKENSYNFIQITNAGCHHIKGLQGGMCGKRSEQLAEFLKKYPDSIIIYSSRIPLLLKGEKFDNQEGNKEENYKPASPEDVKRKFPIIAAKLVNTLNVLKKAGDKLLIVYPVPEQGFNVITKLFRIKPKDYDELPQLTTSYDIFKSRVKTSYKILDKVTGSNVYRVYPEQIFCNEVSGRCIVSDREKIYFSSDSHVSPLGSSLIVTKIAEALDLKVPDWSIYLPRLVK